MSDSAIIDRAKTRVAATVSDGSRRLWKRAVVPMYTADDEFGQRLALFVLQGSPPRGWVVALLSNDDVQWADAIDMAGRRLCRITAYEAEDGE